MSTTRETVDGATVAFSVGPMRDGVRMQRIEVHGKNDDNPSAALLSPADVDALVAELQRRQAPPGEGQTLLQCPFCRSEAVETDRSGGEWYVVCNSCECHGPFAPTETEAEHKWNTRAQVICNLAHGQL